MDDDIGSAKYLYNPIYIYETYDQFLRYNFPSCNLYPKSKERWPEPKMTLPRVLYDLCAIKYISTLGLEPRQLTSILVNVDQYIKEHQKNIQTSIELEAIDTDTDIDENKLN